MKKIIAFMIFVLGVCLLTPMNVSADADAGDVLVAVESRLTDLINSARANPLETMAAWGIDPDAALAAFPQSAGALAGGMPPLASDERLKNAASAHTDDMLYGNFYGHGGSDGRGYEARIESSGYDALLSGESLGFIAFFNYMDAFAAAENIFRNMLRDELNPALDIPRNLLNPEMQEIGVAFGVGQMTVEGRVVNAYLVTCNFAAAGASRLETELLVLINQARVNPLGVAASMGMDVGQILADQPEFAEILNNGLPPLAFQKDLWRAAGLHARDMLENAYFAHTSPGGATAEDRMRGAGYAPEAAGESIASLVSGAWLGSEAGARELFEALFRAEIRGEGPRNILNPQFRDAGIRYQRVQKEGDAEGGGGNAYHLIVCNFGASASSQITLAGVVYHDADGNGLFSLGEGIPGAEIRMEGPAGSDRAVSNGAGAFARKAFSGAYALVARAGDQQMFEGVEVWGNETAWFPVEAR